MSLRGGLCRSNLSIQGLLHFVRNDEGLEIASLALLARNDRLKTNLGGRRICL